jgi:hypothetical protein
MQSGTYTLHVRKSTDSGATWSGDLRTITNATNPALAINKEGRLGFLYQHVDGVRPSQQWQTAIELTFNDFASKKAHVLANTPANTPAKSFDPHLGNYLYMMAVGKRFYGIFCANNTPDHANFPNGVTYQRNTDFATKTLLAVDNITPVGISIDPFFFSVGPGLLRSRQLWRAPETFVTHAWADGSTCCLPSITRSLPFYIQAPAWGW